MLLDNKNRGYVGAELKKHSFEGSKLAVLSSLFTLYGFSSLKKELSKVDQTRLYLTDWQEQSLQSLIGTTHEVRLLNQLDQKRVAAECAKWIRGKIEVKASLTKQVTQNLIHLQSKQVSFAIHGSATISPIGLGDIGSNSLQMNMGLTDTESSRQLLTWFDSIWADEINSKSIKKELIEKLDYIAADQPANFVYFLTLFNLFKDFLEDIDEENIIRSKTGFKDTIVWNKLYKFQKDGVLGAIDKLEKHNGCIIADSVGLGKTFEALAVIKYYELRNDRVLVLCPKKLRDNWTMYIINDKRNLLASDRFNYDVLNHTDLSRSKGYSGEINLETLNWNNYDLIVIDESHNFRNNPNKAEGKTRYERLLNDVIRSGVKTKVLMLSATPVNNRMNDLKNQVAFITEGQDTAFNEVGIKSIESTLKLAQKQFNQWVSEPVENRTTATLLDSMSFDYFKLLDIVTIARSRKHIEKYYGTADIGRFPTRLPPKNIYSDIDLSNEFPPLKEVNKTIRKLSLAGYSPLKFVRIDKKEEYARRYDKAVGGGKGVFRQVDREESLIHLMRVNLLKRMESSIHSFTLTVSKLLNQVESLLSKIDDHDSDLIDALNIEELQDIELESTELEQFMIGNKTKVLLQDMDLIRFRQELEADKIFLSSIVEAAKGVTAQRDAKLELLKQTIAAKVRNPLNPDNKKVIVFTAFADTAQYLYSHIAQWASLELGIHSALITGGGTNKTTLSGLGIDLNNILTTFSPVSKERHKLDPNATTQLDLLIATDCISEGQNLQDCDTLINYDIHWNPVRIIQRFGRVDRLGSKNTRIQLVNFWPNMELDEYINLEAKVSGRMMLLDISATGEENVIDENAKEMNDLEYRRKQLQQLKDAVVDLEDMTGGVSITDLTLNDFRMDLSGYINQKENLAKLENAPFGFYSVTPIDKVLAAEGIKPGVVFCLKNIRTGTEAVQVDSNYPLAPYFLVYVSDNAVVELNFTQSKKIIDLLKRQAFTHTTVASQAVELMESRTRHGQDMEHYQHLLAVAVDNIAGKSEEKGIESLFIRGGTVLSATSSQGIEDFAVVSYLILTDNSGGES
ncbi:MAG: helicase [Acinetobacter johnsonii]|uniref:Helicase n=1 Tax=Acinetobacter johnsonii TaxID=40214 RepID=A0A2W5S0D8_ACIJO|nr:helicase-related protein [Acinetobacter sp. NEB 394]PZQ92385.1 MAG: helicase [Acinetobacter johnsonii]QKY89158.1 DEAD/DEAH box helicase family protein [Acinetobacter sp. NEB 394]HRB83102.1 helicase-related protein [Acinetobacter johnsonii]